MKNLRLTTKGVVALMASTLLLGGAIGGTMAWLTSTTETLTNTFTATDIEVTLVEDKWGEDAKQIIPGAEYDKDPVVTVTENTTVDCYLFVKFEETENADNYITYTSTLTDTNDWTALAGVEDVWYRVVKTTDTDKSWHLLANDKVTISEDLTKEDMPLANVELKYSAYAVQYAGFEDKPADAWATLNPTTDGEEW